jgi:plastocyanin
MSSRRMPSWIALPLVLLALTALWSCAAKNNAPATGGGRTARELDSGNIASGATYEHRFFSSGSFPYHCAYHSAMTGTVTVNASAADSVFDVDIAGINPFTAASVKPGGRVVWHNTSGMAHTVTSD